MLAPPPSSVVVTGPTCSLATSRTPSTPLTRACAPPTSPRPLCLGPPSTSGMMCVGAGASGTGGTCVQGAAFSNSVCKVVAVHHHPPYPHPTHPPPSTLHPPPSTLTPNPTLSPTPTPTPTPTSTPTPVPLPQHRVPKWEASAPSGGQRRRVGGQTLGFSRHPRPRAHRVSPALSPWPALRPTGVPVPCPPLWYACRLLGDASIGIIPVPQSPPQCLETVPSLRVTSDGLLVTSHCQPADRCVHAPRRGWWRVGG